MAGGGGWGVERRGLKSVQLNGIYQDTSLMPWERRRQVGHNSLYTGLGITFY